MLTQKFYLDGYDWIVKVYYAVDRYYINDILEDLLHTDITSQELKNIETLMEENSYNVGFTFTNSKSRESIIVLGLTTSAEEFQDTYDHEKGHLAMHIASYYDLNPYGEELQYLQGQIGKKMFKYAKMFLCDKCREGFSL